METTLAWRGSKTLKCSICLEYFKRPHTLKCGHTFCISCLRHLRRTAFSQNTSGVNIKRLKVLCPTCRRPTPALTIVKGKLNVNYSLQQFVDVWLQQQNQDKCKYYLYELRNKNRSVIRLRSVGSKSGDEYEEEDDIESRESFSQLPSRYYACHLSNSESQVIAEEVVQRRRSKVNSLQDTSDASDDSSTSLEQFVPPHENQDGAMVLRFTNIFRNVWLEIRDFVGDVLRCPNRSVMALVWSGYTFSIMMLSFTFFPYIVLYSVLFLLILYAESVEHRRQNRH